MHAYLFDIKNTLPKYKPDLHAGFFFQNDPDILEKAYSSQKV